jgi:hypothetical protein
MSMVRAHQARAIDHNKVPKGDATGSLTSAHRVIKGIQIKHLVRTRLHRTQTGYHRTSVSHRILPTTSGIG